MSRIIALVAVLAIAITACGDDEPAANGDGTETTVAVSLKEFSVIPAQTSAPAGSVTFQAKNDGKEMHELVVVRTTLAPESLPVKADGAADEEGTGVEALGEIEEFAAGSTQSKTFDMTAGSYVLFCNIVETDEGETEAHYKLGMRVAFTVT